MGPPFNTDRRPWCKFPLAATTRQRMIGWQDFNNWQEFNNRTAMALDHVRVVLTPGSSAILWSPMIKRSLFVPGIGNQLLQAV